MANKNTYKSKQSKKEISKASGKTQYTQHQVKTVHCMPGFQDVCYIIRKPILQFLVNYSTVYSIEEEKWTSEKYECLLDRHAREKKNEKSQKREMKVAIEQRERDYKNITKCENIEMSKVFKMMLSQ